MLVPAGENYSIAKKGDKTKLGVKGLNPAFSYLFLPFLTSPIMYLNPSCPKKESSRDKKIKWIFVFDLLKTEF